MVEEISRDLVSSLRICAEGEHCDKCGKWEVKQNGGRNACEYAICKEAADAIEELSKERDNWKATAKEERDAYWHWFDQYQKDVPKWIPVTERLPEEKINPNTRDFEYVLCTTIWGDVRPFKYGTPIGNKDAHFWNGAGYVDAYVTHWMPLPSTEGLNET